VLIYTSNEVVDPTWIEPERVTFSNSNADATLIPLRSAQTGPLKLQVYVEKPKEKSRETLPSHNTNT
jgi:hypothetical protein